MAVEAKLPLFVINLDRSPDRLKRFMADNSLPGLAIARFVAVDGRMLDRDQLVAARVVTDDLIYSDNAVACSLSHLQCWQKVIDLGQPAVICEDDAVLRRDFVAIHQRFGAVLADADLIYWSYNFGLHMAYEVPGLGVVTVIPDNRHLNNEANVTEFRSSTIMTSLYRPRRLWGLACYTITPRGAQKLLSLVLPLRNGHLEAQCRTGLLVEPVNRGWASMCLDSDLGLIHVKEMNSWVAMPPVAVHRTDENNVSTIDDGDDSSRFRRPYIDSNGNARCFVPLDTPSMHALAETAAALCELKSFDMAVTYLDSAIRLEPRIAELHFHRGVALVELRRHDEALSSFESALALNPNHDAALNNLGAMLGVAGRLKDALASFDAALALNPNSPAKANRDLMLAQMAKRAPHPR